MISQLLNRFQSTLFFIALAIMLATLSSAYVLLNAASEQEKKTLLSDVQVFAKLIGNIAQFDREHNEKKTSNDQPDIATLEQVNNAFKSFTKSPDDYEYLVGTLEAGKITFLAFSAEKPPSIDESSLKTAVPMRKAINGEYGIIKALDYDDKRVFAAFAPIPHTQWGLVIKKDLLVYLTPFYHASGLVFLIKLILAIFIFFITFNREQSHRNQILKYSRQYQQLIETNYDWVWEVDKNGIYTYASPQIEKILGYKPQDILGKSPFELMPPKEAEKLKEIFEKIVQTKGDIRNIENINIHKNGQEVVLLTSGKPFFDPQGRLQGFRGVDKDITELKTQQAEIEKIAFHDPLTSLPNRPQMLKLIAETLTLHTESGIFSALLYLDIDGFKDINDAMGHDYGDEILIIISKRISNLLRHSDIVGRFGGDEFVILLRAKDDNLDQFIQDTHFLLNRIITEINNPIRLEDATYHLGVSIGIALVPQDGQTVDELVRHADTAMYQAKHNGKNQYYFYHQSLQKVADEKVHFKNELVNAFKNNEFELFYQTLHNVKNNKISGIEALIRWNHPLNGYISPIQFLPYITEFRLTEKLDRWVIQQTCQDIEYIFRPFLEENRIRININITPESFERDDFVEFLLETSLEKSISPTMISLEITEDSIVRNLHHTSETINLLSSAGFTIAIDDFGTGYSSLSYLSTLSFQTIKIDKSFIQKLDQSQADKQICKLIIGLAQELDKYIVAEGVENDTQLDFLKEMGVEIIQGYYFAKPVPVQELITKLETQSSDLET